LSASLDSLAAIGVGILLTKGKGVEGEGDGRGWEKRGEERGREGLPPLYLTSGYGPVYYGFFSPPGVHTANSVSISSDG